jgi:hypothetical protein
MDEAAMVEEAVVTVEVGEEVVVTVAVVVDEEGEGDGERAQALVSHRFYGPI